MTGDHRDREGDEGDEGVRVVAADAARQLRGVLAALTDPDQDIVASAGTRNRLEGAVTALDQIAAQPDEEG